MSKVALILAIVAIGEGAVTVHLVRQVHIERENAQTLQASVTELEQNAPQPENIVLGLDTPAAARAAEVMQRMGTSGLGGPAFSTADSSTLCTSLAPFFGVKRSVLSASPTGLPRTRSATRRHFCGEMRAYFSFAETCMIKPLPTSSRSSCRRSAP